MKMTSKAIKVLFCLPPLVFFAFNLTVLQTLLISLALLVFGLLIDKGSEDNYRLPPGPLELPIIGSLHSVMYYGADNYFFKLYQRYGSMVTVNLGSLQNIVINDYDTMKEFSNNLEFQGRASSFLVDALSEGHGVANSEGKLWKHQRRFLMHSLRDSGMGKIRMEEKISSEVEVLTAQIAKSNEEPITLEPLLQKTTLNVIFGLTCNKLFSFDDPDFNFFIDNLNTLSRLLLKSSLAIIISSLKIFIKGTVKELEKAAGTSREEFVKFIREHEESLDESHPRDYIDLFLIESKKSVNSDDREYQATFTEKQLKNVIVDLIGAGTETSSTTIRWAILYMINYPEIQTKVQKEIDDVTGGNRAPTMADKPDLPFTMATLQEVERLASVVPLGIPRSNPYPAKFRQYFFPARITFMFNIHAIHRDPKIWTNPEEFNPNRFINNEGIVFRPPYLVPFGSGKRSCAGEGLARMEIYLLFTTLLQKFTFLPPHGKMPQLIPQAGSVRAPKKFEVVAKLRI